MIIRQQGRELRIAKSLDTLKKIKASSFGRHRATPQSQPQAFR